MFLPKILGLNLENIKKVKTAFYGFLKIGKKSKRQPIKLWVDQGRGIYNNPMQKWLDSSSTLMNLTARNENKSIVAERFIRPLKGKIYKIKTASDSKSYLVIWIN